jgi:hypothetical protein
MSKTNADVADLTPELRRKFLSFLTEVNGHFEVGDTRGLLMFIVEHGKQYPALYNLFDVNEEAVIEHFERTGAVPPGVELTQTTIREDSTEGEYVEQYQRMIRSYARFVAMDQGQIYDRSSEKYDDEVFAFFLNCYHLKDWIKNDRAAGLAAQNHVENFINSSYLLKLCADICNSHKHLRLKAPRSDGNPRFTKRHYKLLGDRTATTISVKFEIETSRGPVDAFTLATQCIDEWKAFIISKCEPSTIAWVLGSTPSPTSDKKQAD